MKRLLEYGCYLLIFLLPWQTVWIIQEQVIGPVGAQGVWQYSTLKIYAIEFLILFLAVIFSFCYWNPRGITFRGRRTSRRDIRLSAHSLVSTNVETPCPLAPQAAQSDTSRILFIAALLLFAGFSILWSGDKLVALFAWVRLCEGAFLFYLFRTMSLRWSWFIGAWIAAALIQSILGMWQFGTQMVTANTYAGIAAHNPLDLGTSVVEAGDRRWLRAYGGFPHPNILGTYLVVSILLCCAALTRTFKKSQWIVLIIGVQIMLIALLFTFSRSAWLSLLGAGVMGLFFFLKKGIGGIRQYVFPMIHPGVVAALIGTLIIGVFALYFSEEMKTRFGLMQSRLETKSVSERFVSIERALPVIQTYWLSGTGVGNFTNTLFSLEKEEGNVHPWYMYQPIHNVFLLVFAELGIAGLLLFIILFYIIVRGVYRSTFRHTGYALLAALFIPALFDHFLWTLPMGVFLVAIIAGKSTRGS